jgi:hypothetical protein
MWEIAVEEERTSFSRLVTAGATVRLHWQALTQYHGRPFKVVLMFFVFESVLAKRLEPFQQFNCKIDPRLHVLYII